MTTTISTSGTIGVQITLASQNPVTVTSTGTIVTTGPYLVRFSAPPSAMPEHKQIGAHGFDPAQVPDMKASFFAAGPDIRAGATVAPFENVDIYPLVAKLLGLDITHLKTGPIDGEIRPLQEILINGTVSSGK